MFFFPPFCIALKNCFLVVSSYFQYLPKGCPARVFVAWPRLNPATSPFYPNVTRLLPTYIQLKSRESMNHALCRQCQEPCHFLIYTGNVKMSVSPAASGKNISQSKAAQIPLLLAPKKMKMQQSSSCLIVFFVLFFVHCCYSLYLNACVCI